MANIIDNAIMSYSFLWPGSAEGVAGASKAGKVGMGQQPGATSQFVRIEAVKQLGDPQVTGACRSCISRRSRQKIIPESALPPSESC